MFLDLERNLYLSFGLPRSIAQVFPMTSFHLYAEKIVQDGNIPRNESGIKEDLIQMGGDFTVDCSTKTMSFLYPSKTIRDRPSVDSILQQ